MTDKFSDLGDEYTTCLSCGARMKADRTHCLRCFQPLHVDESTLPIWRTLKISDRIGATLAIVAAVGVVALGWFLWTGGANSRPTLAHESPAPPMPAKPSASSPQPATSPAAAASRVTTDDTSDARRAFEERLKLDPTNEAALIGLGGVLERTDALAEAVEVFHRAAAAAPGSPTPRLRAASIEARLGRQAAAIADYRAALRLVPDDYTAHAALAAVLHSAGDDRAALEELDVAARLAPDAEEAARVRARRDAIAPRGR